MSEARGAGDDIPPRYEHKFLLTLAQAEAVHRLIAPFCVEDESSAKEPGGRYLVTSLYLDSPRLTFWREWELGTGRRFKLRVRRYGERLGDSPVFLEVKQKLMDITVKRRAVIPPEAWLERARGMGTTAVERDFCARRDRFRCEPALLVRYERKAYKGVTESYARVTFDSRLQFQRCRDWTLAGDPAHWCAADDPVAMDESDPRVLLEVKFEREVPRWIVHMLRTLELDRRGFSKYGVGVLRSYARDTLLDAARREPVAAG